MEPNKKIQAIKHVISTIYNSQKVLQTLAPEYKWTGMGNLLGDYGEFLAIEHYDLIQAPVGSEGFDALTKDKKKVQVKANHSAKQIGIRGKADLLLVLGIKEDGEYEEIYYGDFEVVLSFANYSSRDNKHMVSISKLKQLNIKK